MYRGGFSGMLCMLVLVGLGIIMLIHPTPPSWANAGTHELNSFIRSMWSTTGALFAIVAGIVVGSLSIKSGD